MKYSNLTYYLLFILCTCFTSCVAEREWDDSQDNKAQDDVKVQLTINFPATTTRGAGESEGSASERRINDVQLYTFDSNGYFIETASTLLAGTDGDNRRTIFAQLQEDYTGQSNITVIAIINTVARGIPAPSLTKGASTISDLCGSMIYTYNTSQPMNPATEYIPMWGICKLQQIIANRLTQGTLEVKRAIAKIDLTIKGGEGLENFEIKQIAIRNINKQGYFASQNGSMTVTAPFIPATTGKGDLTFTVGTPGEGNSFINKIYIPEQKNINNAANKTVLEITAIYKGQQKEYTIEFVKDGNDYDLLRNNLYRLNVTGIDSSVESNSNLLYEVENWEDITVKIPTFD